MAKASFLHEIPNLLILDIAEQYGAWVKIFTGLLYV